LGFHAGLLRIIQDQSGVLQKREEEISSEWCNNLSAALEVVEICIHDAASAKPAGDALMALGQGQQQQQSMLKLLTAFATHGSRTSGLRSSAWKCLTASLHAREAKVWLEESKVELGEQAGCSLALGALHSAAFGSSPTEITAATKFSLHLCLGSTALQNNLAAQLAEGGRVSSDIAAALFCQGDLPKLLQGSAAAAALTCIIANNSDVKQILLSARIAEQPGGILPACAQRLASLVTQHGAKHEAQQLVSNYSIFLAVWMSHFPPAASAFLESIKQTPFLVGVLLADGQFGAGGTVIRGMCAVLLGLCCIYAPAGSAVDPGVLKQAISGQIGFPRYEKTLEDLLTAVRTAAYEEDVRLAFVCWHDWLESVVVEITHQVLGSKPSWIQSKTIHSTKQPIPFANGQQTHLPGPVTQPADLPVQPNGAHNGSLNGLTPSASPSAAPPIASTFARRRRGSLAVRCCLLSLCCIARRPHIRPWPSPQSPACPISQASSRMSCRTRTTLAPASHAARQAA